MPPPRPSARVDTLAEPPGSFVVANGMRLWFDEHGDRSDPSVLLVMGHGLQAVDWPSGLVDGLVRARRHVVRFDNRDSGRSEDLAGRAYTVDDMVDDVNTLVEVLALGTVHIVGCSMGGVLSQLAVQRNPGRFRTLTAIMSSPGDRDLPPEHESYGAARVPGPGPSVEDRVDYVLRLWRAMNGAVLPFDEAEWWSQAELVVRRGWTTARVKRQLVAALSVSHVGTDNHLIDVPTLVIHGTADTVLPYPHGEALARRIRGARFLTIDGMGHLLHPLVLESVTTAIVEHTATPRTFRPEPRLR